MTDTISTAVNGKEPTPKPAEVIDSRKEWRKRKLRAEVAGDRNWLRLAQPVSYVYDFANVLGSSPGSQYHALARIHAVIKMVGHAGYPRSGQSYGLDGKPGPERPPVTTELVAELSHKRHETVRAAIDTLKRLPTMNGKLKSVKAERIEGGWEWRVIDVPRYGHWVQVPPGVLLHPAITDTGLALWALVRECQRQCGDCYLGVPTLAKMLGVSHRQVQRLARQLQAAGLLKVTVEEFEIRPDKWLNSWRALTPAAG